MLIYCLRSKESHLTTIGVRKLQGGMSSMQIGLEALQSSVDGVQSRVDGVQSGVSIMRADVGTTLNHMNRLQIRIDGVQTSILKQHEQESLRHNRDAAGSILSWLSQIDFADQQADLLRRRERGTGEWLLNSSKYKDWTNSRRATLFCPGPPGAGKTIMASIIIDDLCKTFRYARDIAVAYIFYNFRSEHEHQPEDILSSLTRQIIQDQPVPVEVRDLFELHKARRTRPSSNEIISTLSSVCTSFTSVFIVVDALDECRPENRDIFLSQLFDLQNKAPVNILATSRMIPEIDILFKDHEQLVIRATAEDIQRYLETRISRLPLHIRRLQGEIKTEIINAADGMYVSCT
ncbi:hypothetical protein GGR51DRAFT_419090 [Nemania sp. FL0031]|nr:hypothetical protein GGR51DRAFT_419090 [Nemania sp. FL0031]